MNVYIYHIDNEYITANECELINKVSAARREKVAGLKNPAVRAESLAAGLLLEYAIYKEKGLTSEEYEITEGKNKKPEILVRSVEDSICCNLSHSGGYAAAAVGDMPIGIDIETKSDKEFRVTRRMFSDPERERVERILKKECGGVDMSVEEEAAKMFRDIWTEKEAYLKCTGEGITGSLKTFYKDEETGEIIKYPAADKEKNIRTGYYVRTVRLYDESCSLSVCMPSENFMLDIVTVHDL